MFYLSSHVFQDRGGSLPWKWLSPERGATGKTRRRFLGPIRQQWWWAPAGLWAAAPAARRPPRARGQGNKCSRPRKKVPTGSTDEPGLPYFSTKINSWFGQKASLGIKIITPQVVFVKPPTFKHKWAWVSLQSNTIKWPRRASYSQTSSSSREYGWTTLPDSPHSHIFVL